MTAALHYTETVLAELAYLVSAAGGDGTLLNATAGFSSYCERPEVIAAGAQIRSVRGQSATELGNAAAVIARSTTAFAVRGAALPELTALYFIASDGLVEVTVIDSRMLVTAHPVQVSIGGLLARHLQRDAATAVFARHEAGGGRRHLAFDRGHHAYSEDGLEWQADTAGGPAEPVELLAQFAACGGGVTEKRWMRHRPGTARPSAL